MTYVKVEKMKAVVQGQYGLEHIDVESVERPQPGPGQVLIRTTVASMNAADWHLASDEMKIVRVGQGLRRPKAYVKGTDGCGVVEAVAPDVADFDIGDIVFGIFKGAFAEYAVADVDKIALAPEGVTPEDLASLPIAGVTALQAVEAANVDGASVVVVGASGGVGHYAIQLARTFGAATVDGVCSAKNEEMVKGLGVDRVIDYNQDDFTSGRYDVVIDCVGSRSIGDIHGCLNPGGRLIMVGAGKDEPGALGPLPQILWALLRFLFSNRSVTSLSAKETRERLERLAALQASGDLRTLFDVEYSLDDISEAYQHLGSRRAAGKILIRPS